MTRQKRIDKKKIEYIKLKSLEDNYYNNLHNTKIEEFDEYQEIKVTEEEISKELIKLRNGICLDEELEKAEDEVNYWEKEELKAEDEKYLPQLKEETLFEQTQINFPLGKSNYLKHNIAYKIGDTIYVNTKENLMSLEGKTKSRKTKIFGSKIKLTDKLLEKFKKTNSRRYKKFTKLEMDIKQNSINYEENKNDLNNCCKGFYIKDLTLVKLANGQNLKSETYNHKTKNTTTQPTILGINHCSIMGTTIYKN